MRRRIRNSAESGMTLLELIIACTILLILASMALPIARFTVIRQREKELRLDLRDMRNAIDKYKDMADQQKIRVEVGSEGYPPDLDTLVKGVAMGGGGAGGKNIRFLRRVPVDPMTGRAEWGMRSVQDDPDSTSWGGNKCSTCIRNQRARRWTARSIRTGRRMGGGEA